MPDRQNSPDRERVAPRDPGHRNPGREREPEPRRGAERPDRPDRDEDDRRDPDSGRTVRRADDAGSAGGRN